MEKEVHKFSGVNEEEKKVIEGAMKIHINTTPNIIKHPNIKNQIEKQLRDKFEKELPKILERMGEMPALLTCDVGFYSSLLEEATRCYEFGLYYATISLIGISAERFAIELSSQLNFEINDVKISEKDLFRRRIQRQELRLSLLEKSKIITPEIYKRLIEINSIRNKYIHPRDIGDIKKDSLKILKLFVEILNLRFSDKFTIREGKIVNKDNSQTYSIKVD